MVQDFFLGTYEVTREEWQKVTGLTPSQFSLSGGHKEAVKEIFDEELKLFPVESVWWEEVQIFLGELNKRAKEDGWVYRLPKEDEWEYACRGGPTSNKFDSGFDFYLDKPANQLQPEQANFEHDKGLKRPCKVGSYKPYRLGLYDMHGNVSEWGDDTNKAAEGASRRLHCGGSWNSFPDNCRSADRSAIEPASCNLYLGLRLARVPVGKENR
jgi:formylglycine-generating enzyme required for sulfatase activity